MILRKYTIFALKFNFALGLKISIKDNIVAKKILSGKAIIQMPRSDKNKYSAIIEDFNRIKKRKNAIKKYIFFLFIKISPAILIKSLA